MENPNHFQNVWYEFCLLQVNHFQIINALTIFHSHDCVLNKLQNLNQLQAVLEQHTQPTIYSQENQIRIKSFSSHCMVQ